MRGANNEQSSMFSYISAERRVPKDHPLRAIRAMADIALKALDQRFAGMYAALGRPSIAPERLLRALLLQVLYTVRSERLLMEHLDYNFLFRWFVGLGIDDPEWDVTVFTKNRDRLLKGEVAEAFFGAVLAQARQRGLLSDEHFTVDGTLIEAWAGQKSFKRKDGKQGSIPPHDDDPSNPTVDFHGEQRSNDTHQSTTDPEALLARKGKGKEAKLSYAAHVLMENRHGLAVNCCVTQATGRAEPEAALAMVEELACGLASGDLGCRQRLRPQRTGSGNARASGDPAFRAQANQYHRPAHHSSSGVRAQSAQAQTGGRDLRLGQDRRRTA